MRKIVSGDILKDKISEAINLLCNTVKTTLGPKGSNIIIDHSILSPFITNDGVTIAENIESDDEVINTILTLTKEASIKTNEIVGDGTTTTLVLLQGIYEEGIKKINNGYNPILLKKEIDTELNNIISILNKETKLPTKEQLYKIAKSSGNSELIGKLVSEAYQIVPNKEAINLVEISDNKSNLQVLKGYIMETIIASSYFFHNNMTLKFSNSNLLLINNTLDDIYVIEEIINNAVTNNIPLVIIANDYSDIVINELLSIYFENKIKLVLLKTPEYGDKKNIIFQDIKTISQANIIVNVESISVKDLGNIDQIEVNNERTIINFEKNLYIDNYIKSIKPTNEFNKVRLSMFDNSLVNINISANTTLERRELKMRFDDAICATNEALKGISVGGGLSFYKISDELLDNSIFKQPLKAPLIQVLYNSGIDSNFVDEIKKHGYKKVYNVLTNEFEDINNTNVIDPTSVLINSLINASSIASMLLTTTSIVINEHSPNNHPTNFNEI